jgi:uncharacterized protein with HEPN domain
LHWCGYRKSSARPPAECQTRIARYPEIPWPQIVGLRNRLIHGYDAVDLDILWQIIEHDLPPLIAALQIILEQEDVQ